MAERLEGADPAGSEAKLNDVSAQASLAGELTEIATGHKTNPPVPGKLDFLIHPDYKTASRGETSEHEQAAKDQWLEEIEKIAADPRRILIILSSSTASEQDEGQAVDVELISTAEKQLGTRCIVAPYIEEDLSVYADEIKKALVQSGLIDGRDLTAFSSSAFGEYAEACVVQIADELNRHLGLKKKTQVKTRMSLSIHGENNPGVNTEVRRIINELHLNRVVTND